GAQRLSASSEFSLPLPGNFELLADVLNAFRHHRNSHTRARPAFRTLDLCAQRLSASSEFSPQKSRRARRSRSRCSTPFGIIGILALSIMRHAVFVISCSTPFGIIGILTSRPHASAKI